MGTNDDLRPFRFDLLREGDTFFSRSDHAYAAVIAYAEAWGDSKAGRKRARKAVRDHSYPNHAGSILESWGQRYPVEASPRGYVCGSLDDYRTDDCRIVRVMRWSGFDEKWRRELAAQILERWARKATRVKYDWAGAVLSSPFGRWLFTNPARAAVDRLFCSAGVLYLHAMCGIMNGQTMSADTPLHVVAGFIREHPETFPRSANPVDILLWMAARSDFQEVRSLYLP